MLLKLHEQAIHGKLHRATKGSHSHCASRLSHVHVFSVEACEPHHHEVFWKTTLPTHWQVHCTLLDLGNAAQWLLVSVSVKFWRGSAFQCATGFKKHVFLPQEYVRQFLFKYVCRKGAKKRDQEQIIVLDNQF
jgi:hypothetical protein